MSVDILAILITSTITARDTMSVEIVGALRDRGGQGSAAHEVRDTTPSHTRVPVRDGLGVLGWSSGA